MPVERKPGPAEGGRPRRVRREEVRRRLLDVAYGVFAERGYEGASLERVAEAAGFSKGAVYSNFANKDELFYELIAARIDERAEAVRKAAARTAARTAAARTAGPPKSSARGKGPGTAEPGGAEALARLAGLELRGMGSADPAWQTLFIEFWLRCARNEGLRAKLAEKRRAMRAKIAALVEKEASALGVPLDGDAALDLATIVLALSNGLGIEGIMDPEAVRPELFGEVLARLVAPSASPGAGGGTRTS
ncbi:MAG TPA: TetR/AcrR family transcriptional regulator [Rectinemataceae bacterium]|nr:TetR/AcrR family transcriptional regulator [Rectinemataceae bacterium]